MSSVDRTTIRQRVREIVDCHEAVTVEEIVLEISRDAEYEQAHVVNELDELERHGFVYFVDRDDEKEVRMP